MRKQKLLVTLSCTTALLTAMAPGIALAAQPGLADTQKQNVLQVQRGSRIGLNLNNVTRIVPKDEDVARGSFVNGKPFIEGITTGTTMVDVYQGGATHQLISVEVVNSGQAAPLPALATTTTPATPTAAVVPTSAPTANNTLIAAVPATSPTVTSDSMAKSGLGVSLRVAPAADNPQQALISITFGNRGSANADGVEVHYTLDDAVSYVTGSATGNPTYDAAGRELVWRVGSIPAGSTNQTVQFRVEAVDNKPVTFLSIATIKDSSNLLIASNQIRYSTNPTPLLTVFALPDRILSGRSASVLVDVQGAEPQNAVDRLQKMGIVNGRAPGLYYPNEPTQRAEYAVMTLKGLNLHDLKDITIIKFVLGRKSVVNLNIVNSQDKVVAQLVKNVVFEAGERTAAWDGRTGTGFAPPGKYTYVCTAKDTIKGETTVLQGHISIVPQSPLEPTGTPTFKDIKRSDWFAGYLAAAEKRDLVRGYGDGTFRPAQPISRVEATAVLVRALGLEDKAQHEANTDSGFLDYNDIPSWAVGYVNVATRLKTANGHLVIGYPGNTYLPNRTLRRDEAAMLVARLVDKETAHSMHLSGQIAPGAAVTIDGKTVPSNDAGNFEFVLDEDNSQPVTVAVLDLRH